MGWQIRQLTTNDTSEQSPQISGNNVVWEGSGGSGYQKIFYYNGTSTIQLSTNDTNDFNPLISGNNVVWEGSGGSDGGSDNEIFYWNGTSTTQLNTNDTDDMEPRISGNNVVWAGRGGSGYQKIFYYNGTSTIELTTNESNENSPRISGNNVVWTGTGGSDGGEDFEIFYWNGTSTTQLTTNNTEEYNPQISGNNVVWLGTGGSDAGWNQEIFYYNGTSTIQLTTNDTNDMDPRISGNNVVWLGTGGSDGGGDSEIFYYNGTSTIQLTTNNTDDYNPQISGNNVVWFGSGGSDGGSDFEIFYYNGTSTIQLTTNDTNELNPQISGNNVVWEDSNEIFLASLITNSNPTGLELSNLSIAENQPANTVVGNFSTIDPDVGDTFTYSLVTGSGSEDNSAFTISGNQLIANNSFDFESKNSYNIRVKTTDNNGATLEKALTINVLDVYEQPLTTSSNFQTTSLGGGNDNYTASDKVYQGTNPQNWKNDGAAQISADVGGDNRSYISYTGTTGNTAGNANDGNAETFTALDGDGSDLNNSSNAQLRTWINQLVAAGKLTGIGVGSETNTTTNLGASNNPEIQSGVGIGSEDRLLINFGTAAKTANVSLALFFGQEAVNWRWLSQNYQNPTVNSDVLLNQFSRAAEQAKYQLLKADVNGIINVNGQKYTIVQDWQTAKAKSGSFAIGTNANTGNAGLDSFTITSDQAFDTILFSGQDYNPPTPIVSGFRPNDVSDYLLNGVTLLDQIIYAGDGNDTINASAGSDTIHGQEGDDSLIGGTGADVFFFDRLEGVDSIGDFNASEGDVIQVYKSGFLSQFNLGYMSDADFKELFSYSGGSLSFDADGNGPNPGVELAKIQGSFNYANDLAVVDGLMID